MQPSLAVEADGIHPGGRAGQEWSQRRISDQEQAAEGGDSSGSERVGTTPDRLAVGTDEQRLVVVERVDDPAYAVVVREEGRLGASVGVAEEGRQARMAVIPTDYVL